MPPLSTCAPRGRGFFALINVNGPTGARDGRGRGGRRRAMAGGGAAPSQNRSGFGNQAAIPQDGGVALISADSVRNGAQRSASWLEPVANY
jgi:hypothetical protein